MRDLALHNKIDEHVQACIVMSVGKTMHLFYDSYTSNCFMSDFGCFDSKVGICVRLFSSLRTSQARSMPILIHEKVAFGMRPVVMENVEIHFNLRMYIGNRCGLSSRYKCALFAV